MKEVTQKYTGEVERLYKDRIFRMIFSNKTELLSLYNAMNGTNYENPDELEINTLEHAIYMGMRNDLSFLIDSRLSLYEHQSTYNPNLPLRDLWYVGNIYSGLTRDWNLYGRRIKKIPVPRFVVFYNGAEEQPERKVLRLSEAFEVKEEEPSLELKVIMLNINKGYNEKLMNDCKTLRDYVSYVDKVRTYAKEMTLKDSVEQAVRECIADDILADFLRNNRAEAVSMSIFEYDEELHMRQEREESKEAGREEGKEEGKEEGREEGREEERQRLFVLSRRMIEDGLSDEISRLITEPEFLVSMYEKYHL